MHFDPSSIPDAWPVSRRFVLPEWKTKISPWINDHCSKEEVHTAYRETCFYWLDLLASELGPNYYIAESENFLLLCAQEDKDYERTLNSLGEAEREILKGWKGVAQKNSTGPHVVILFEEISDYYDYVSLFHPEAGEFGGSCGMMINRLYYHMVIARSDFGECHSTLFHELTHVLVSHLPLPLWLNESLAMTSERLLTRSSEVYLTPELASEHHEYWDEDTIQDFWNGEGFHAPDPAQKLCYSLADILVCHLIKRPNFRRFVLAANWQDAGQAAALKYLGGSVGDFAAIFLGDGYWEPDWLTESIEQ